MSSTVEPFPKIKSQKEYTDLLQKLGQEFEDKYTKTDPSPLPNLQDYLKLNVVGKSAFGDVVGLCL